MKTCTYQKHDTGFSWDGDSAQCCIMAIHRCRPVYNDEILLDWKNKTITEDEFYAINEFDLCIADDEELRIIEQLADKLDIKLEEKQ